VSALAGTSVVAPLMKRWRDPARWLETMDTLVILIAFSLPWSTSLVALFITMWSAVGVLWHCNPAVGEPRALLRSLRRPASALPIALFALAVLGMLWSDAPWGVRLAAIAPPAKLLVIPFLLFHFERSERGLWVFVAFLVSCLLMLAMSWIVVFDPALALRQIKPERGVFIKDYIDQSQEFVLCAVALAYPVFTLLRAKRIRAALLLLAVSLSFVINMMFVIVSRTALVTMPILLAVFALLHLQRRTAVAILCTALVLGGLAWTASPPLRSTTASFFTQYQTYKEQNAGNSIGLRLEFLQKSLRFFAEAPVFGHGTGSTRGLFEQDAVGKEGAAAEVIGNPHNQTLNVAVQWGVVGIVVLYAMWLQHLLLFRGDGLVNWIGLLVVVQNISTSLFNSHLFDFHEGWMYVLGVGVAGGMLLKANAAAAASGPKSSVAP
jgi:O-antigen ligase